MKPASGSRMYLWRTDYLQHVLLSVTLFHRISTWELCTGVSAAAVLGTMLRFLLVVGAYFYKNLSLQISKSISFFVLVITELIPKILCQ